MDDRQRRAGARRAPVRPRDRFGRPLPRGAADEMPDRREPEQVVSSAEQALAVAAALFDAERFFEAHEYLEHIWKSDAVDDADRAFWKGVTQVAVGCCHAQRGNAVGALALLQRAATYLRAYRSPHQGVDTAAMIAAARQVAEQVRRRGAGEGVRYPTFPLARP